MQPSLHRSMALALDLHKMSMKRGIYNVYREGTTENIERHDQVQLINLDFISRIESAYFAWILLPPSGEEKNSQYPNLSAPAKATSCGIVIAMGSGATYGVEILAPPKASRFIKTIKRHRT